MTADLSGEDTDWDSHCLQCGECCFEKIEDERGTIFYTRTACRFLDVISRECKIFERRFEINPGCVKLTPELVETLHWLPRDCGYRRKAAEATGTAGKSVKKSKGRKKKLQPSGSATAQNPPEDR